MSKKKKILGLGLGLGLGSIFLAVRWSQRNHNQSLRSYLVHVFLEELDLQGKTNEIIDEGNIERVDEILIQGNRKPVSNPFTKWSPKGSEEIYKGMQVFTWNDQEDPEQDILLFFHGGGYVRYPTFPHLTTINSIGRLSGAKIVMPIYLKAPEFTYKEAFGPLKDLYLDILSTMSSKAKVFLLGDSAGGGLALGFTYYLIDQGIKTPDHLSLVSPWLDLTNSHDKLMEGLDREVFFGYAPLNYAGLRWAGTEDNLKCKYVSPIFGDTKDLSIPISLAVGTHEAFYYDILDLGKRLKDQGLLLDWIEGEKQHHDWILYPTPEGRQARRKIANRLKSLSNSD